MLCLEDGTVMEGKGFGAPVQTWGELVFTTTYTGYEESLTDPSYNGQILMFTYPLIGNYAVNRSTFQSDSVKVRGVVIRELCEVPYHYDKVQTLDKFLKDEGIPGISGVDTRWLTLKVREKGTMKASIMVGDNIDREDGLRIARTQLDITEQDLVSEVTCKEPYMIKGDGPRVVVIDTGVKANILNCLKKYGFNTVVVPYTCKPDDLMEYKPDGILLSNGPGDPKNVLQVQDTIRELYGSIPLFGICLGHQIASLALGGDTYKLKFGHRGANQPVKHYETKRVFITSQNHGFAVDPDTLEGTGLSISCSNVNDGSVEGVIGEGIETVQFHPEGSPGPSDFDEEFFLKMRKILLTS